MLDIRAAYGFFTLAGGAADLQARRAGVAFICFPLAGLFLGLTLVLVNRVISPYLSTEILALLLLTILIVITGGQHLAGTQETFNKLAAKSVPAIAMERRQIYGLLALLLVVLFKIRSIEVVGESRVVSLLLTPLLARWSLLLFLFGATAIDDGARRIAENLRSWQLLVATVLSLALAHYIAGLQALWVALCLSILALLLRGFLQRREGGVSLANCGALIELSEALGFTLFASL